MEPRAQPDYARESRLFDAVAEVYEEHRPGYPQALVDRIACEARLGAGSAVLEIGSGTGKATDAFAPLGCSILCIEPGENLIAVAIRKFGGWPKVRFHCSSFEDWPLAAGEFDLVFSAQAFHWVKRGVGAAKAAAALGPGGVMAAFWKHYPGGAGEIHDRIQAAYVRLAPGLAERRAADTGIDGQIAMRRGLIEQGGHFGPLTIARYPWSERYTTRQYMGLLNTYSDHLSLDPEQRGRLLGEIAQIIDACGGVIERSYVAVLYLARKV